MIHSLCKPSPSSNNNSESANLRQRQNLESKVILDSNPDSRINPDPYPDPDDCRICPKIFWMHYLVGVSHLAKYRRNRPLTVYEKC